MGHAWISPIKSFSEHLTAQRVAAETQTSLVCDALRILLHPETILKGVFNTFHVVWLSASLLVVGKNDLHCV